MRCSTKTTIIEGLLFSTTLLFFTTALAITPGGANWTAQLGSTSADYADGGVALDSYGNAYIAGYTYGGLDGNSNIGGVDLVLVKYDNKGVRQWTLQTGTAANEWFVDIAIDSSDNIYVTGFTDGDMGENSNAGVRDIFLAKYSSTGVVQWVSQVGTTSGDEGHDVAVDSSGNIYVSGFSTGMLDGNTHIGGHDAVLIKFDSTGVKQWTRQIGSTEDEIAFGVAVDSNGGIYISGHTFGEFDGNTNAGQFDVFLVKYNDSGVKQWTRQLGTVENDMSRGPLAVDSSDNIYVAGDTSGGLDGNVNAGVPDEIMGPSSDAFLVKYNSSGVKQWTQQFGTPNSETVWSNLSVDGSDNIYLTGHTHGAFEGSLNVGQSDIFLAKYNSTGSQKWVGQLGSEGSETVYGVAVDNMGYAYVTGFTNGNLDGNLNAGSIDIFLTQIDVLEPVGTISIENGDAFTNSAAVSLVLSCDDGAGVGCSQMSFSNDGVSWSVWETYSTSKAWTINTGDGSKTVYVRYQDLIRHISESASDTIILDTTAPVITLNGYDITIEIGDNYTDDGAVAADDIDGIIPVATVGTVDTAVAGVYTLTYDHTDAAGNAATQVTRTVTVVAPAASSSGGGGCTLSRGGGFDPLFPLLLLISGVYLWRRRALS